MINGSGVDLRNIQNLVNQTSFSNDQKDYW